MNYSAILFTLLLICSLACQKESVNPQVCPSNPLESISWLKEIHENFQKIAAPSANRIIQYEYKGACVFLIDPCYQCPDGLVVVYNSAKEIVCEFGSIAGLNTCPDFYELATNKLVL